MLTPRGWMLLFLDALLLAFVGGFYSTTLAVIGLALLAWFLGEWLVFGVRVQFCDLHGLCYQEIFVAGPRVFRVLPPLTDIKGHAPAAKRHNLMPLFGIHRHRRPGSGSELLDLREYFPGDPPKTIAWKASARRDRLMTKEFESEVPVRCTLFVDTSQSVRVGRQGQNALSRLVAICSAVAQATAGARDLTGLCVFDEQSSRPVSP